MDASMESGVSTIMVSYHTGAVLFEAIEGVLAQDALRELILVDNGNPDAMLREIHRRANLDPRLVVISGHGNIGFAAGCNLGARRASGNCLLFLNPDCRLPTDALPTLLAEAARRSQPWMLGCRLVNPDGSEQRGARREMLTPRTALAEVCRLDRLMPGRFTRVNLNDLPVPRHTISVPVISGACMILPTADYWRIGGMDEGYFLHVEDIDFCHRFRAAGGEIFFVPQVSVLHHKGTSGAGRLTVEWHKTRGFMRHFRKNFNGTPTAYRALVNAGILARFAVITAGIVTTAFINRIREPQRHRGTELGLFLCVSVPLW
jgi:N-acetylglucosaminyl-diphospho-decaprenol L-rhamnosyltransferase